MKSVFDEKKEKISMTTIRERSIEVALNRIWTLIREGRLLKFLDYQGALIREVM